MVGGQKVPLERPRVRDVRQREVALGSYEMLQQASLIEESVWHKIMHGLTTRRYGQVVRELQEAYGIEKLTVSEHFIGHQELRVPFQSADATGRSFLPLALTPVLHADSARCRGLGTARVI